ncbi:MAG: hypothetical protein FJX46_06035 [Alphaproteobacteria bacterium]|nr:hypothetical protein [Alphaproteobacteria bacterium]
MSEPNPEIARLLSVIRSDSAASIEALVSPIDPAGCGEAGAAAEIARAAEAAGNLELAVRWFGRSAQIDPKTPGALAGLGLALSRLGAFESAWPVLTAAERAAPGDGAVLDALTRALIACKRHDQAAAAVDRLVAAAPGRADSHYIAGVIAGERGRPRESLAAFLAAARLAPRSVGLFEEAVKCFTERGWNQECSAFVAAALELAWPDNELVLHIAWRKRYLADWMGYDALTRRMAEILQTAIVERAATCNTIWALAGHGFDYAATMPVIRMLGESLRPSPPPAPMPPRLPRSRIRVGWLQLNSRFHSTQLATRHVVERLPRQRFEVFGYGRRDPDLPEDSPQRAFQLRFRGAFDRYCDLADAPAAAAAERVRADDLDILIEMQGLNLNNGLDVVAHRPARITAHYYGFLKSCGADFVDYLIADRGIFPPEVARLGVERMAYLPGCHLAPTLGEADPQPLTRTAVGLPQDGFVFCNFNNPWKFEPHMFALWMRLLAAVPGSVLWLCGWHRIADANLRAAAAGHGIDPARLVLAPVDDHPKHLRRVGLADLALNNLYSSGGVTTFDTLWGGVPVVALEQAVPSPWSRMAGAMLKTAGLGELVVPDLATYEALALALARDPVRLGALRGRLRTERARMALFDIDGVTRHLGAAFETMFAIWAAGEKPRDFDVAPAWSPGVVA